QQNKNMPSMQFLFGDRELLISISDLLEAPVKVIVNSTNRELSHTRGLSATILAAAGEELQTQSTRLIHEYGHIDSGMAVYTTAGDLPYDAIIHAVGPQMGEGEEQRKITQAVSRSLLLCEANEWTSIAFPAIGCGSGDIPIETCAQAFHRAITHFWDARNDSVVEKINLCLTEQHFQPFFDAFREDAITEAEEPIQTAPPDEDVTGEVELSDADIADLENDDMADWFK
ncbi:MAG: macro domain-containing protein, partial [Proteobacteria bacterium]|nr:macro domain-containing protein [Pseudomonadota bacterium]